MAIFASVRRFKNSEWGVVRRVEDFGSHVPEAAPPLFYIDIAGYTPQPVMGEDWWYDHNSDLFTQVNPNVKEPAQEMRPKFFWLESFTSLERSYIWAVCNGETPPGVTINIENRYRIAAFKEISLSSVAIKLDNEELVAVIDGMEAAGIIGAGRADEILQR